MNVISRKIRQPVTVICPANTNYSNTSTSQYNDYEYDCLIQFTVNELSHTISISHFTPSMK